MREQREEKEGIVLGLTEHSRLLARYRWAGRTTEELDRCALSPCLLIIQTHISLFLLLPARSPHTDCCAMCQMCIKMCIKMCIHLFQRTPSKRLKQGLGN